MDCLGSPQLLEGSVTARGDPRHGVSSSVKLKIEKGAGRARPRRFCHVLESQRKGKRERERERETKSSEGVLQALPSKDHPERRREKREFQREGEAEEKRGGWGVPLVGRSLDASDNSCDLARGKGGR
ncbi:hypothetical protein CRG98_029855 [Punica granatum]|uniref:Uncharacterized protein n=1 Tax=Punica granatum TaxID=22663 RepID=A0A2I0J0J8_PUNGR|nr:hypothetical protein CRG98_029855 [Punica granatum]